jgi:putative transposase
MHGFDISEMEIDKGYLHLFLLSPPKYSMARVVELLKSVSSKVIRTEFSGVTQQLWGGKFWEDGYFVRTVGDKVTTEVIR